MNKDFLNTKEYEFLKTNPNLGNNIIILTLGGSYAYGTNTETSDIDVRGCALNTKYQILSGDKFDVITDNQSDTTIYSFNKLISLLTKANPNTIEILGCRKEDYFYVHPIGKELLDNYKLFLSQEAYYSFGGYATAQLRRLSNKSARTDSQTDREKHILGSVLNAKHTFPEKYGLFEEDSINLYIDSSDKEEMDTEIFIDVDLHHYPLRDYKCMWAEMHNIVKEYSKLGKRNSHAIEHNKLGKHMMHLVRLYLMGLDILEKEEINTYREQDHDFLMEIRNGKYLDNENHPTDEFYELVNDFEKRFNYAKENTSLPKKPDYKKIKDFVVDINERVVKGKINSV